MDFEQGGNGGEGAGEGVGSAADFLGGGSDGGSGAGAGAGGESQQGGEGGGGEGGSGADITGGADPDWYGSLSGDADGESASNRDWVKAKGFKDLDGMAKALRSAEKAIHDTGRVKIPGEGASEAEVAAFHKAIGVPDDVKGYAVEPLTGEDGNAMTTADGKPVEFDQAMIDRIAPIALKAGVPVKAFSALVQEVARADLENMAAQQAEELKQANEIAKGWGKDREENLAAMDNAAKALNLSRGDLLKLRSSLGPEKSMGLLVKIGNGIREDTMIDGGGRQSFGLSGSEAQAEMDRLKKDKSFVDKAMLPGSPENARWKRLQDAAGQAADRRAAAGL